MKQYKLKKVYPGLKELDFKEGDIVCYDPISNHYKKNLNFAFPARIVENNPEYWEEVIEKEWEILEVRKGSQMHNKNSSNKNLEYWLASAWGYSIYSVKRSSDKEVFTIGDQVNDFRGSFAKIEEFILCNNTISVMIKGQYCHGAMALRNLIKSSKPKPFITQDGVEKYEGETIYSISQYWELDYSRVTKMKNGSLSSNNPKHDNYLWFSNLQIAENYIYTNKPIFSVKDIEGISYCTSPLIDILRIEAKKRIKL